METLEQTLYEPAILSFENFRSEVTSVYDFGKGTGCPSFDCQRPSVERYSIYFKKQPNMYFAWDDDLLPEDTYGAVIKNKESLETAKEIDLFYIFVSNKITDEFLRCFVIAHELGHILMHGRLMKPGMHARRRDLEWHRNSTHRTMMEVEANIYAFFSIIPAHAVEISARIAEENGYPVDLTLWRFVSHLYARKMDIKMIKERLLIHNIQGNVKPEPELKLDYEWLVQGRSWIFTGLTPKMETRNAGCFKNSQFHLSCEQLVSMTKEFEAVNATEETGSA